MLEHHRGEGELDVDDDLGGERLRLAFDREAEALEVERGGRVGGRDLQILALKIAGGLFRRRLHFRKGGSRVERVGHADRNLGHEGASALGAWRSALYRAAMVERYAATGPPSRDASVASSRAS